MVSNIRIVQRVADSQTLTIKRIAAETAALQAQGAQIVNLSQGVPSLPIFPKAREKMLALVETNQLPYCDVPGTAEARHVAASFVNKFYSCSNRKFEFEAANTLICAGAIQAIYNTLALLVEGPNDVVATTLPAYGLYRHQTEMLGGSFITMSTSAQQGFMPTAQHIQQLLQDTTQGGSGRVLRALVLCAPNNPAGTGLSEQQAIELAAALDTAAESVPEGQGFALVLDEVYLGICSHHASLLQYVGPRVLSSTFLVLSASKGLGAMPGARAAWVTCPTPTYIDHMAKVQLACSGNASTISQAGLVGSLTTIMEDPSTLDKVWSYYSQRVKVVAAGLNSVFRSHNLLPLPVPEQGNAGGSSGSEAGVARPKGTFYVFADFSALKQLGVSTDMQVMNMLRDMWRVGPEEGGLGVGLALVPGSAFGLEPEALLLRFSCAKDNEGELHTALQVVDATIKRLLKGSA